MKAAHIALIITIVMVALIVGRISTSNADFNMGNPYWHGFSKFYEGREVSPVYHLSDLPDRDTTHTTLLIIGPVYHYRINDSAIVESYVKSGGNLVIIDDAGESDSLLKSLNSSIRITKAQLCQDVMYYQSPSFPILTNNSNAGIMACIDQIYTNGPAALSVYNETAILVSTTSGGWIDGNGNNILDGNEYYASYPVIASEKYGDGSLTVIADPDIFINTMIDRGDNSRLADNIFYGNTVYVDLSHERGLPLLTSVYYTLKNDQGAQVLCIITIILASLNGYVIFRRLIEVLSDETQKSRSEKQLIIDFMEHSHPERLDEKNEIVRKL